MTILSQLTGFLTAEALPIRLTVALLILVLGHLAVRIYRKAATSFLIERKEDANRKTLQRIRGKIQYSVHVLNASVIAAALFYLNAEISQEIYTGLIGAIPNVLSVVLILILGVIGVNIVTKLATDFFKTVGFRSYIRNAGVSQEILQVSEMILKGILYLLILQFILTQANLAESTIQEFVTAASWALALLLAGLLFYGFKDLFQNLAAGLYLKNSRAVRPGEQVKFGDETGELQNVSTFSTEIDTQDGYSLMAQNREIMSSHFKFKKSNSDLDTLEEIIQYFVTDKDGFSGPASMEMALDILGYSVKQEEFAEKASNKDSENEDEDSKNESQAEITEEDLMKAVEDITEGEVLTAWIESDHISDVGNEFKTWFNDGGMVVPTFDKSKVLPSEDGSEYAVVVGVEGTEVLVIDPSRSSGGVYYINKDRLLDAMEDHGYIVLAPVGTRSEWRVKNDLIYSDKSYYDELSKNLENRLRKIVRQGSILKDVMPEQVQNYTEEWKSDEKVSRVWKPE